MYLDVLQFSNTAGFTSFCNRTPYYMYCILYQATNFLKPLYYIVYLDHSHLLFSVLYRRKKCLIYQSFLMACLLANLLHPK